MKSHSAQRKVIAKAGSVSLTEARAAARAAKTPAYLRLIKSEPNKDGELWKRYLGQFGPAPRKPATASAKKSAARKTSARKVGKKR